MTDREVLAFDLYGTLVDPIAISGELDRVLGGSGGREVARLWRLKRLGRIPAHRDRSLRGLPPGDVARAGIRVPPPPG